LLRVGMPWPLKEITVRDFAEGLQEILVVEEKHTRALPVQARDCSAVWRRQLLKLP